MTPRGSVVAVIGLMAACTADRSSPGTGDRSATFHLPARAASAPVPDRLGFGRAATEAEILALDIDVGPGGRGLPPGTGTPSRGGSIFAARCATCHGATGRGGPNDQLVGREPLGGGGQPRTIGNYWPYATTLFDYVRRAMPFDTPGSLTDDEVYSLVAWLLYQNGIVAAHAVMDASTLPAVAMPARDLFVPDDRLAFTTVR